MKSHAARARNAALLVLLLSLVGASAQEPLRPPANGPKRPDPAWHALVGATVHGAQDDATLLNTTVVLRNGVIVDVTTGPVPAGARVWDCAGLHVYPGLIDAYVEVETPLPDAKDPGAHWNRRVTPRRRALDGAGLDAKTAQALREMGFCAAVLSPKGGTFRGRAALVSLAKPDKERSSARPPVLRDDVYQAVAFETGRRRDEDTYPNSQMGAIALMRQTLLDADWQALTRLTTNEQGAPNALDALAAGAAAAGPLLFDTRNELEALRAHAVAQEFGRPALLLGSGFEFRRLDAVAEAWKQAIVPLELPERPKVASIGEADAVDLRTLMTWEQAPTNPRRLQARGVLVALTTSKRKERSTFPESLRAAIRHGLDEEQALRMLTRNPAQILGVQDQLGSVERHKRANLVVSDGPLFAKGTKIRDVWIDGRRHEITPPPGASLEGEWTLTLDPPIEDAPRLVIGPKNKITVKSGDAKTKAREVRVVDNRLSFVFDHEPFGDPGVFTMSGVLEGATLHGDGMRSGGERFRWKAERTIEASSKDEEEDADPPPEVPEAYGTPFGPYALDTLPAQEMVRIVGATIWTAAGPPIANGELRIVAGKIVYVGERRDEETAADFRVIDASGKFVTPGLIDCHSHTGISGGVNEGTQACTSEVRIGDVTNPDSIGWYRQLAGGVTCVNSLHGSANPIGGQNQINKVRWGVRHPDDMHFEAAPQGIKFALGENVKQSNWGEGHKTRYPQTRMGVETYIRDRFDAARDYATEWKAWDAAGREGLPPRRDLELEALAEVLAGTRLVHCHSYRQDEILMLCRVAGDHGFKIGTFQHVLEGYKVAEVIREHALGGSAFSDWWAYKVEVQDAIPDNGSIMHDVGVVVSFNSDSNELARRLNVEAAKAVKYGGLSPQEAFKFVSLNPAVQLGIADRVGSLEAGKDGDFVIWSGDPLSTFSRCEATWIDGREYFSLEKDRAHRRKIAAGRKRILQKLLAPDPKKKKDEQEDECDEAEQEPKPKARFDLRSLRAAARREHYLDLIRRGFDPDDHRCGSCGVGGAR